MLFCRYAYASYTEVACAVLGVVMRSVVVALAE